MRYLFTTLEPLQLPATFDRPERLAGGATKSHASHTHAECDEPPQKSCSRCEQTAPFRLNVSPLICCGVQANRQHEDEQGPPNGSALLCSRAERFSRQHDGRQVQGNGRKANSLEKRLVRLHRQTSEWSRELTQATARAWSIQRRFRRYHARGQKTLPSSDAQRLQATSE